MNYHSPVLLSEVIKLLDPLPNKVIVDATLGNGGHSQELLKLGATVYGLDADPNNLIVASKRLSQYQSFHPINCNFSQISSHCPKQIDGLLFDLGLSQNQIVADNRGFSFNDPISLDMRINPSSSTLTAEYIVNTYPFDKLVDIFSRYAQEIYAKPITIKIIESRQKKPIKSGKALADIIRQYYDQKGIRTSIDPATKIFLALKIIVNNEFDNLRTALEQSLLILKPKAICVIISFHSGEDRIVKLFIKSHRFHQSGQMSPSLQEIKNNPLSRSAVLRWYRI